MLSEPVKSSVRPLNRDVRMEREPDRDLKIELCSVRLDVEPTAPPRNSAAPLITVVPMPSEPVRYLPRPLVSEVVRERDPVRDFAKLFVSTPAKDSAQVNVRCKARCPVELEDVVKSPVSAL